MKADCLRIWTRRVVERPFFGVLLPLLICALFMAGLPNFQLASSPRSYQGEDGELMQALLAMEAEFTHDSNILVVFISHEATGYTPETISAIRDFTDQAWDLPRVERVDSITNFQYSEASGDDLDVRDLVETDLPLTKANIARVQDIIGLEPRLLGMFVSENGRAMAVNIRANVRTDDLAGLAEIQAALQEQIDATLEQNPHLSAHLSGFIGVTFGWSNALEFDVAYLFTGSFIVIVLALCLFFRSIPLAAAALFITLLSVASAAGFTGWRDQAIQAPVAVGLLMVMLLAIADSIHVVQTVRRKLGMAMEHRAAVIEAVLFNFKAIVITSVTTAVGFLSFSFSSYEGVRLLGAFVAVGVMIACLLSLTILPFAVARIRVKPVSVNAGNQHENRIASAVLRWRWPLVLLVVPSVVFCGIVINRTSVEDNIIDYMQPWQKIRQDIEIIEDELTGSIDLNFELNSGIEEGVADPEFMRQTDEFVTWVRSQPEVRWASSYTDIVKKLNQDMHGGDPEYYRLPEESALASQYLLLYELLLPMGIDLTHQINLDKSGTRVTLIVDDLASSRLMAFVDRTNNWLQDNGSKLNAEEPRGSLLLTMQLSMETIGVMVYGAALALGVIALILFFVFRAFIPGLLCVVSVIVPILLTYGVWALYAGVFDMAAAIALCMVVGIVVDNSVHFVTKFTQARSDQQLATHEAIIYTFNNIGRALVSNATAMSAGFCILIFSAFKSNATMGVITTLSMLSALIVTFTLLPALLSLLDREK